MKKLMFFVSIACLVVVSSCKEEILDFVKSQEKKSYTVSFKLKGLNSVIGQPNTGDPTEPIAHYISQLTVVAFDSKSNEEIARKTQFATDPTFGNISLELKKNEYKFVVIGSKTEFYLNLFDMRQAHIPVYLPYPEANFQYWQASFSQADRMYKTTDTFLGKLSHKVNGKEKLDVLMQRIVGKLEVTLTAVERFLVEVSNENQAVLLDNETTFGRVLSSSFPTHHSNNGHVELLLLRTDSPVNLLLISYNPDLEHLQIPVSIQRNKITRLTGRTLSDIHVETN